MVMVMMGSEEQVLSVEAAIALSQCIFTAAIKASTAADMTKKLQDYMSMDDIEKMFGGLD